MARQVNQYVQGCSDCQRIKPRQGPSQTTLIPNEVPTEQWDVISIDLTGPLPPSRGHNAIMVVVDRLTKYIIAVPCSTNITAEGTAKIYRDHVFRRFGLPRKVISDRGPQFVSEYMKEFFRITKIEGNPSTAYHPQTDGQTEREHAEIKKYLKAWINERQDNWAEWLPMAEFAINNQASAATGVSPFFLNHGRHP